MQTVPTQTSPPKPSRHSIPNDPLLIGLGAAFLLMACLTLLLGAYTFFAPQTRQVSRT